MAVDRNEAGDGKPRCGDQSRRRHGGATRAATAKATQRQEQAEEAGAAKGKAHSEAGGGRSRG